jgi:hypothetical protein
MKIERMVDYFIKNDLIGLDFKGSFKITLIRYQYFPKGYISVYIKLEPNVRQISLSSNISTDVLEIIINKILCQFVSDIFGVSLGCLEIVPYLGGRKINCVRYNLRDSMILNLKS